MSTLSPEPDWLFLPSAPLTIATGDAVNRWTFRDDLKYRLRSFQPRYLFNDDDQVLTRIHLGSFEVMVQRDVNRFTVFYEDHPYFDAPFWDFGHLAKTDYCPDFDIDENVLSGVSAIWSTAVAIADQELARGRWRIMARPQGVTSPFDVIPSDVWMHFEITDWLRGIAKSNSGETLYSIHLAPNNYALNSDPEAFQVAHPESILVGGKLNRNFSLYRLRTAVDHPTDIWRLVEPEETQAGTTEAPGEAPHAMGFETDPRHEDQEQGQTVEDKEEPAKVSSSSGQEKACERYLKQLMLKKPDTPVPKKDCWEEVQTLFPGIPRKGFLRAWDNASAQSGAVLWKKAGRRKGSRNRTPK